MKSQSHLEPDEALDGVLRQWTVQAPLPAGFQDQVWSRIAQMERNVEFAGFWSGLFGLLVRTLERPKAAYLSAATLLALGLLAGSWTAHIQADRLEQRLGQMYVQAVDPYSHAQR